MSKIPKKKEIVNNRKKNYTDETYAYRSVILSTILGGIFFLISLLLNLEIISFLQDQNILWNLINISIRVIVILLFFLFMITSIGNYKELTGKPLNWKQLFLLVLFCIGQTILNLWVFIFTSMGVLVILIYLYLVQEI